MSAACQSRESECGCGSAEESDWAEKTLTARLAVGLAAIALGAVLQYGTTADQLLYGLVFATSTVAAGGDVFWGAAQRLLRRQAPDEKLLMSIAVIGAFAIGQELEAAAVMIFYQFGELLEDRAVDRTRRSIRALTDIRARTATVLRDGQEITVDPAGVHVGERIVVRPGERIPLDGEVVAGDSYADTSALTGESVPRHLHPGSAALSGCINTAAALTIRVTKPYADSTVARILALVEDSADRKSTSERFVTRFARYYTPAVVIGAVLLALVPTLLWPTRWETYLYYGLVFLVCSCPCALVVSVPLGYFCGIGCASRQGILIKGSNYLEALARADTVVFDKTGTLTTGEFSVQHVHPHGIDENTFIDLAAEAEYRSDHPIAASIQNYAACPPDPSRLGAVQNVAGKGVMAVVDGHRVHVGSAGLMREAGIARTFDCGPVGTNVHVSVDGTYAGHLVIADALKRDARTAVEGLHRAGVRRVWMLTGDGPAVAAAVAGKLGLDGYDAGLLPDEKTARLAALIRAEPPGRKTVYVGDGINDAPSLALADIGVAMGALGSDAAVETADVVIMDDSPAKIVDGLKIARRTQRIVSQNIVFALAVKFVVLALIPFGFVDMWLAIFADVGVLLIAVLNAARTFLVPGKDRKESAPAPAGI
ncbi:MAG: heavy metal translocating P-type ATPase [Candidatus Methanomethylophilus sp.]|nr:heavy metal translocating P-type ATPase [Methanomethylophilus sp.]MDD4668578.1 heavy metal translocating P-type ATPase [Methanomethylophilus sp.]